MKVTFAPSEHRTLIPAVEVTLTRGVSRERLVRMIQTGRVLGELIGGRWFLKPEGLAQLDAALAEANGTKSTA